MYIVQELYDEILMNVPIACVDVCIVVHGAILLVKRNDPPAKDEWWVPGGRVYKGEKLKECAHRKALEEVGLECHVGPLIYTDETIFTDGPNDIPIHSINSCFLLYPQRLSTEFLKLDEHCGNWKWVYENGKYFHPYVRNCLEKAGLEKI